MSKWIKRAGYILLGIAAGLLIVDRGVFLFSRTVWFRERVESAVERSFGREVELGRMGANLRGVFINDITVAEQGGFEQGIFAQVGRLQVRISLIHLLHGHIKIHGVLLSNSDVKLVIYADGTTNWSDWVAAPQTTDETAPAASSTSAHITAERVRFEQLHLRFEDRQTPRTLEAQGVNLEVKNFSLQEEFTATFWANFHHKEDTFERTIPITSRTKINLSGLDFARAYVVIEALQATYQKSTILLQGRIDNWLNPQADLTLNVRKFSSDLLEGVVSVPAFNLPQATGKFKLGLDPEKQTLTVHQAMLQAPGFEAQGKGNFTYAAPRRYAFSAQVTAILGEMGRWLVTLAEPYRLVGTLQAQANLTHEKITAQLDLQDVGGFVAQAGQLSNLTGRLSGWEAVNFKTGKLDTKLDGKFEGNPFTLSLAATQTPQKIVANLKASAKEIKWRGQEADSSANASPEPPVAAAEKTQDSAQSSWPLPPIDLKADLNVEKLEAPYFYGTDIIFDADVTGLTPDLKQTHGMLRLRTQDGKIQDLYKLTNANPLTKVLFMSLNVTGKVFNSLNVLGVLKGLGGGLVSAIMGGDKEDEQPAQVKTQTVLGPDGEPLEITMVEDDQKIDGEMPYDKFDTQVDFVQGKATVKEGTFVSTMMSLRLDGTTDFNTGEVDLTVHAAPGRHEVDGMMPLTLKIGGTIDDPKGSMQLLSSVTSLVTQTVTNNVVSRNVTKGIKGLFGLFKKKDEPANPQ